MAFTLSEVVPWGRSYNEYMSMFNLSEDDLSLRILGCGDGPASFNAVMYRNGKTVISVDPIYELSSGQIRERIDATYPTMMEQLQANQADFVWHTIPSVSELGNIRMTAMNEFLLDFEPGKAQGRYRALSLPSLPFGDAEFDLALCSHFLFLYTEQLSEEFHLEAILEMRRVAKEVRIFPLLDLGANPSPYVDRVCEQIQALGYYYETQPVPYEFQRGGNTMLLLR